MKTPAHSARPRRFQPPMDDPAQLSLQLEVLTVRIPVAMQMTGIGRSKLYELIKARQIETVKLGASTLVIVPSLKRFIDSLRR